MEDEEKKQEEKLFADEALEDSLDFEAEPEDLPL
jgi:hypothetical protein